ncbi:FecR domain-containing protein [Aeoliella sp. SH292]|uniref:FecR domain-containing protein n=1 Tax=Aeoliella sp. SH292 TaxID=3454464 RepID=UPI003F9D00C7
MPKTLQQVIAELIERPNDDEAREQLSQLITAQPELINEYAEQWHAHSLLEWTHSHSGNVVDLQPVSPAAPIWHDPERQVLLRTTEFSPTLLRRTSFVIVASLLGVAIGIWSLHYWNTSGQLISARNIVWEHESQSPTAGGRFRKGVLAATSGSCELQLNSGVELSLEGAFRLDIVNDMLVELRYGQVRAQVPPNAKGFSIDTPDSLLVDQGTEFGVNAETGKGTKVVVFRGEVDVRGKEVTQQEPLRRLTQGEAAQVRVGRDYLNRITQVTSGVKDHRWSANTSPSTLLSVRDNIRGSDSLKYYNVVVNGLHEDVPAWVDRVHQWNGVTTDGIPKIVRGAEYVMTFNEDRYIPSFEMCVTVHRPAILYVFVDNRVQTMPSWLLADFEDTGEEIGLDEGWHVYHQRQAALGAGQSIDQYFSIWRKIVDEPQDIVLGGLGGHPNFGMYGLAATPYEAPMDPARKEIESTTFTCSDRQYDSGDQ